MGKSSWERVLCQVLCPSAEVPGQCDSLAIQALVSEFSDILRKCSLIAAWPTRRLEVDPTSNATWLLD
jgi:hypothetical protein